MFGSVNDVSEFLDPLHSNSGKWMEGGRRKENGNRIRGLVFVQKRGVENLTRHAGIYCFQIDKEWSLRRIKYLQRTRKED
ncbi:hypothetical protein SUGI_1052640 [Cryptomeria japonica]|nr:hypothetical protein SUGI_1052640 [Cryptomeria japonica]